MNRIQFATDAEKVYLWQAKITVTLIGMFKTKAFCTCFFCTKKLNRAHTVSVSLRLLLFTFNVDAVGEVRRVKIYNRVSHFWEKIIPAWMEKEIIYERNFQGEKWDVPFHLVDTNVKDTHWRGW